MCQEHTWQRHKKKAGQQRALAMLVWGGVSWKAPPCPPHRSQLTAQGFDGHGVLAVLRGHEGAHADDEEVAEAGDAGDDPDEDAQDDVGQEVLEGGDAVGVGLAAAHMGRGAAVLELLEVAAGRKGLAATRPACTALLLPQPPPPAPPVLVPVCVAQGQPDPDITSHEPRSCR